MVGDSSSVEGSAVVVAGARVASSVFLAIVLTSGGSAAGVVAGVVYSRSGTLVRINTNSIVAFSVGAHWEWSIVGSAVGVGCAGNAEATLHAVSVGWASTVRCASVNADVGCSVADGGCSQISSPGVSSGAISVVSAVQANSVVHAVSSSSVEVSSSNALGIGGARTDAESSSDIAIDLSTSSRRSIFSSAGGSSVRNNAVEASSV